MWNYQRTGLQPQQMPFRPGWEAKYDPTNRRWFYVNHITKQTQWEDPRVAFAMQQQQQRGTSPSRQQPATETTSFIEPDPIKVKKLVSQYGVSNGMAQVKLRTHSNNLTSAEAALRSMGYKQKTTEPDAALTSRLQNVYSAVDVELIKTLLVTHRNNLPAVETSLKGMGYEKDVKPNEAMALRLRNEYPDAAREVIRYQLLKSKNNFPAARLNLEGLGYVKGGKKTVAPPKKVTSERPTSPPKQKFEMTDAEKNRRSAKLREKFPGIDRSMIDMCLKSTGYDVNMAERVLAEATEKEKRKKEERMGVAKATSSTTETTFPQETTSQSYSPVTFGEDERSSSPATSSSYSSARSNFASASSLLSSKIADAGSRKPASGSAARPQSAPKQRQKKVQTLKAAATRSKTTDWVPSANRTRPNGPNPALRKGPDPSLLITDYITPKGPNKANYTGPQSSNRCGPLPSNRMGPAGLAHGPLATFV